VTDHHSETTNGVVEELRPERPAADPGGRGGPFDMNGSAWAQVDVACVGGDEHVRFAGLLDRGPAAATHRLIDDGSG
jgi:hypothetical protein